MTKTVDSRNRPLRDLRVSVTDRCNFRCVYCMPKNLFKDHKFLPYDQVLSFEEIARVVKLLTTLGVKKVRLTGGEPLVRKDVEVLIKMLSEISELEDLAMTTNGSFPLKRVRSLRKAGLKRMTVSLDSLDNDVFEAMNDVGVPVQRVLDWIEKSISEGFSPVKVNMVVKKGVNLQSILPMARFFNTPDTILRFIEYMDVGTSNGWKLDEVVPSEEILAMIDKEMPIEPIGENYHGEVAKRWRYKDSGNEFGIITSVTQPFCGGCTRARLSASGSIYTCLFSNVGTDLKSLLRSEASDKEILNLVAGGWKKRKDNYSEIRSDETTNLPKVEMSFIGG